MQFENIVLGNVYGLAAAIGVESLPCTFFII